MNRKRDRDQRARKPEAVSLRNRRGVTLMTFALLSPVILGFVAFSVDTGSVALTVSSMQSAVDAAALAASQEIALTVETAADQGQDGNVDTTAGVREMARNVAQLNGVYIDPQQDVVLGRRYYTESSGTWDVQWGSQPYNAVKVIARRDQADVTLPDGEVQMAFAWVLGQKSVAVSTQAIAFVQARDIVSVLDFSGSMNDDSEFKSFSRLGQTTVETNQQDIFNILGTSNDLGSLAFAPAWLTTSKTSSGKTATVTFKRTSADVQCTDNIDRIVIVHDDGSTKTYSSVNSTSTTVTGNSGDLIDEVWVRTPDHHASYIKLYDSTTNVKNAFGLNSISWPWASGSWDSFISHCRNDHDVYHAGYRRMYGGACLVDYLLGSKYKYSQTDDLWKTPHYPFNAMKEGMTIFSNFLIDLGFGDELGLVSYATYAQWETSLSVPEDGTSIDISSNPITSNISQIDTIQRHKQAGHYANMTAMGEGFKQAREMLLAHKRYGTQLVILMMTDGNANIAPSGWSPPSSWDWNTLTDFDGDGTADYTTSNTKKLYAFYEAKLAMDAGIVVHTLSVGSNADHNLMEAIAKASGGTHVKVDLGGNYALETLEQAVKDAYNKIAGKVPPPKLVLD